MNTSDWGPSAWDMIHTIASNASPKIDKPSRTNYIYYFDSLCTVLPCRYCRESFCVFLYFFPIRSFCKTRLEFEYWAYIIHALVSEKLAVMKTVEFYDVVSKYEQRRVPDENYRPPTKAECDEVIAKFKPVIEKCRERFVRYMEYCKDDNDDMCRRIAYNRLAEMCRRKKATRV
jgi:hypothetical protein